MFMTYVGPSAGRLQPLIPSLQPPLSVLELGTTMRGSPWSSMCEGARAQEFFALPPTPFLPALQLPLSFLDPNMTMQGCSWLSMCQGARARPENSLTCLQHLFLQLCNLLCPS
jgi:hypothetical protein